MEISSFRWCYCSGIYCTSINEKFHVNDIVLMLCVSSYPCNLENINMPRLIKLREFGRKVGYSGHETGLAVSFASLIYGITSLERHITLDRSMYGSDQSASLELRGMKELDSVVN